MAYSLTLDDISETEPSVNKGGYNLSLEDIDEHVDGQPKRNLLGISGTRVIPEEQRKQLPEFAAGAAQGVANIVPETYNIMAEKPMKPFQFAPDTQTAKQGELVGDIGSFFIPGLGFDAALAKTAAYIPKINKLLQTVKSNKPLSSLLKMGKVGGETSLFAARKAPEGDVPEEALKGFGIGAGTDALMQAIGSKYPILSRAALMGAGYLGGKEFGHPYSGMAVAAMIPQLKGAVMGVGREHLAEEALEGLSPEKVKKAVEANERLGTVPTPGQAAGSYVTTGKEGRIRREAGHLGEELERTQIATQKKAVNKLLDDIYKPTIESERNINVLYDKANEMDVNPKVVNVFRKNHPILDDTFKSVTSKAAFRDIPENNYKVLSEVQREMQRKAKMIERTNPNEAYEIREISKEYNQFLKDANPAYEEATKAAQPKMVREKIEDKMNLMEEDLSAKNAVKKLIGTRRNYRDTVKLLRNFPEARKALSDMRQGWKEYANMKTTSQAEAQGKTFIDQARNVLDYANTFLRSAAGKRGIEQKAKYIHSKEWFNDFDLLEKAKDRRASMKKTLDMLGKLGLSYGLTDKEVPNLKDLITQE